jgi:hypothetical protein
MAVKKNNDPFSRIDNPPDYSGINPKDPKSRLPPPINYSPAPPPPINYTPVPPAPPKPPSGGGGSGGGSLPPRVPPKLPDSLQGTPITPIVEPTPETPPAPPPSTGGGSRGRAGIDYSPAPPTPPPVNFTPAPPFVPEKSRFEKVASNITRSLNVSIEASKTGQTPRIVGSLSIVARTVVEEAEGLYRLGTTPIKQTGKALFEAGKSLLTKEGRSEFATTIKEQPIEQTATQTALFFVPTPKFSKFLRVTKSDDVLRVSEDFTSPIGTGKTVQNPILEGGSKTSVDYDFVNVAGQRVTGTSRVVDEVIDLSSSAKNTGKIGTQTGDVITELKVADRTFEILERDVGEFSRIENVQTGFKTRFNFFDGKKTQVPTSKDVITTDTLTVRQVKTFIDGGKTLVSFTEELIKTPKAVTTSSAPVISRQILGTITEQASLRSTALAVSGRAESFVTRKGDLFVTGTQKAVQTTETVSTFRTTKTLESSPLGTVVSFSAKAPQFSFGKAKPLKDRFSLIVEGAKVTASRTVQPRSVTLGTIRDSDSFLVFAKEPAKASGRPFDFGIFKGTASKTKTPELKTDASASVLGDSSAVSSGGLSKLVTRADDLRPPIAKIEDLPGFGTSKPFDSRAVPSDLFKVGRVADTGVLSFGTAPVVLASGRVRSEDSTSLTPRITTQTRSDLVSRVDSQVSSRVDSGQVLRLDTRQETRQDTKQDQVIKPITESFSLTRGRTDNRQDTVRIPDQKPITDVFQRLSNDTRTGGGRIVIPPPPRPPPPRPPPPPKTPPPPLLGGFGGFRLPSASRGFVRGFAVEVRKGGVFKRQTGVFTRGQALEFGAKIVSTTPSASFRIVQAGAVTRTFSQRGFFRGFQTSKREAGVFIEPRQRRISSAGELQGITVKGLRVRSLRRKGGL